MQLVRIVQKQENVFKWNEISPLLSVRRDHKDPEIRGNRVCVRDQKTNQLHVANKQRYVRAPRSPPVNRHFQQLPKTQKHTSAYQNIHI